ncbi:Peroxisomal biogenesis factor 11 [Gracilaria domingensis]|nr:Peroxisomal biogenesis factor 11 [Gracilaria domingensis]
MSVERVACSPLVIDTWHRALSNSEGRDKLFRLVQYVCKLLRGVRQVSGMVTPSSASGSSLIAVESAMATSRQISRLLKWTSVYVKRRHDLMRVPNSSVDISNLVSDLALFAYYLCDNVTFLCKMGVVKRDTSKASRRAARFWMLSVMSGLFSTVVTLMEIRRRHRLTRELLLKTGDKEQESDGEDESLGESTRQAARKEMGALMRLQRCAMVACTKQLSDLVVSCSLSTQRGLHTALVGGCGVVSSAVGCWQTWPVDEVIEPNSE